MVWGLIASAVIGGVASLASGRSSRRAAEAEGERVDQLEREKFAQAKVEADRLRELGDDAAAVALEEAELADLGAERYETFSNEYAQSAEDFAEARQTAGLEYAEGAKTAAERRETAGQGYADLARDFAARNEQLGVDLYERIGLAADERERIGAEYGVSAEEAAAERARAGGEYAQSAEDAAAARATVGVDYGVSAEEAATARETFGREAFEDIQTAERARAAEGVAGAGRITGAAAEGISALRGAAGEVMTQAERAGGLQTDAFGNITQRYSPFLGAEEQAIGQLSAELGLSPGEQYTGYRDSPAYSAAQDASRVAEQESIATITQDAANAGTLYSGTRGAALVERAKRGSYERAGIEQSYYQNYMQMLQGVANPQATGAVSGFEATTARDIGQGYIGAAGAALGAEGIALSATMRAQAQAEQLRAQTAFTGTRGSEYRDTLRTGVEGAPEALGTMVTGLEGAPYALDTMVTGVEGAAYQLPTMRTGGEGAYLRDMLRTGTEGAAYQLPTMTTGVEGAPYELDTLRTGTEGYPIAASGFDYGTAGSSYRMAGAQIPLDVQATAGGMVTGNMPGGLPGSGLRMEGYGAWQQSVADVVGGAANIYSAYLTRPQYPPQYPPMGTTSRTPGTI